MTVSKKYQLDEEIETLRESEERYELAVRGSQDGLWDWNIADKEIYYSSRWKSMLGYEDHEIGPRIEEWLQRIHPDDRQSIETALFSYCTGETANFEKEFRMLHKSGSFLWVLCRGIAVRDGQGKACRICQSDGGWYPKRRRNKRRAGAEYVAARTC